VLQHVSDHKGSIIREPCTVLGYKLQEWFYRVRWHGQCLCYGSIFWHVVCVCVCVCVCVVHCTPLPSYTVNYTLAQRIGIRCHNTDLVHVNMVSLWSETCWSTFKYFIILILSTYYILCINWIVKCLIIIDARCKHEDGFKRYLLYCCNEFWLLMIGVAGTCELFYSLWT